MIFLTTPKKAVLLVAVALLAEATLTAAFTHEELRRPVEANARLNTPKDCAPVDLSEYQRCAAYCRGGECRLSEECQRDCVESLCKCICHGPDYVKGEKYCIWQR